MEFLDERSRGAAETLIERKAPDLGLPLTECATTGPLDPCTLVIFGASGDLTARKVIPALYNLFVHDSLPSPFTILGCARTSMSDEDFRARVGSTFSQGARRWEEFAAHLFYHTLEYNSGASYGKLAERLHHLDSEYGAGRNRVFYLAVPPDLYPMLAEMIGRNGMGAEDGDGRGWVRI
ncbi:MAG TPA: glucose-6-phosphate dehydrogenase, partial [Syntrophobacteria bacterium]|nr:glucose-6-phosphate dehydrogenase [Syntrophobacteria bacterium]